MLFRQRKQFVRAYIGVADRGAHMFSCDLVWVRMWKSVSLPYACSKLPLESDPNFSVYKKMLGSSKTETWNYFIVNFFSFFLLFGVKIIS